MNATRTSSAQRVSPSASDRVHWGVARTAPDGWQGVDGVGPADLVAAGLPLDAGSVGHLYVGPAIGQIDTWNLPIVLEEFRRVLRRGGTIRISAYDVEASIDAYRRGDAAFFWDRSSSLAAGLTAQLLDSGAARSLFTGEVLVDLLRDAGFGEVTRTAAGISMDPTAGLAALDAFDRHCCHVEAVNSDPWPSASDVEGPSAIHLGWGDPLGRTHRVVWSGPADSAGSLAYRTAGSVSWRVVAATRRATPDGPDGRHVFRARTDALEPGCRYEYEVRQELPGSGVVSDGASFSAPPSDPTAPVRLGFLADTGVAGRSDGLSDGVEAVLQEMARLDPHVVLGGGDYAYRSSDARWATPQQAVHGWLEQMAPLLARRPFMAQYGNHEVSLGERHRDWAVHLPVPGDESEHRRSYSFDLGPCHVAAFYAPDGDIDPTELGWLWADLAAARERRDAWLIVFQHQPLLAHGSSHPAEPQVQRTLSSVLQANRVDLHLSAHDQNYERSFPIAWTGDGAIATSNERHHYRRGEGVVLAKVSPGGKRSDRGGSFSTLPEDVDGLVARADDTAHHIALIRATSTRLTLETHAVSATQPSVLIDQVEVVR